MESSSRLVVGTMRMTSWGAHWFSPEEALAFIKQSLAVGINIFDTADIYGHYTVEALLGSALALEPSLRGSIKIITKCGINLICEARPQYKIKSYDCSVEHILEAVSNSLKALKTHYLDLLLIHRPDPFTHPSTIAKAFKILKEAKTVLNFGVSNYTPFQFEALERALEGSNIPLVTNQIEFSLMHTAPLFDGTFDFLMGRNVVPQVYSPLGGTGEILNPASTDPRIIRIQKVLNELAAKYSTTPTTIAHAFVSSHPSRPSIVLGTTQLQRILQLQEGLNSIQYLLQREDWFKLLEAAEGKEVA